MAIALPMGGMEVAVPAPADLVQSTPQAVEEPISRDFTDLGKDPRFVQVTNLSTKATDKQIQELFAQIGDVVYVEIFPKDKHRNKYGVLVAFIEYRDPQAVVIAQHLTSTVFIDRPIVVVPVTTIPSEYEAVQLASAMSTTKQQEINVDSGGILKQLVSTIAPTIPSHIANPVLGNKPQSNLLVAGITQAKELCDSSPKVGPNVRLIAATGIPLPLPPTRLSEDYSNSKEKEVRRCVFVDNLNPFLTAEHILNYFQFCGDIRFLRIGGEHMSDKRFAFIEFYDLASVLVALQYDGADFCNMQIRVVHSRHWLEKPPTKRTDAERENDLLMKRLKDAQALIENAINEESNPATEPAKSPKRSSSKSRRRSRERRRSRSKSHDRSKSRKKKSRRHSRSRSRDRKRSKSRERKRSKSRSKSRERKKRSRSRDRRR